MNNEDYQKIDRFFSVVFMTFIAIAAAFTLVKYIQWLFQ